MSLLARIKGEVARGDRLLGHSMWLMAANLGAGVFNVLYQRVTSGMLSLEEYGSMQTLLTQLSFLILPFSALSTGMMHYSGRMKKEGRFRDIAYLVHTWLFRASLIALGVTLVFYIFAAPLSDVFNLGLDAPILVMCLAFSGLLFLTVLGGALQGMQLFPGFALTMIFQAGGRVLFTWLVLFYSFRAAGWAVLGNAIGYAFAAGFAYVVFRWSLPRDGAVATRTPVPMLRFASTSLVFLLTYQVLSVADILFAKRWFTGDDAGRYAQISVLARLVVWVSFPFARAMFPKVVSDRSRSHAHQRLLMQTLGVSLLAILPIAGGVLLLPEFCFRMIYPQTLVTPELLAGLRWLLIGMSFNALLYVLLSFELAQNRSWALLPVPLAALGYLSLATANTPSFTLLPRWVCLFNAAALVCTILVAFVRPGRKMEAAHA